MFHPSLPLLDSTNLGIILKPNESVGGKLVHGRKQKEPTVTVTGEGSGD